MKRILAVAALLALGFVSWRMALVVRAAEQTRTRADEPGFETPRTNPPPVESHRGQPIPAAKTFTDAPLWEGRRVGNNPFAPVEPNWEDRRVRNDPFETANKAELQKKWLDLMAKRAAEMTKEELEQQVAELTQRFEAREKEAGETLHNAMRELEHVVNRYRGTAAADGAQSGLDAIRAKVNLPALRAKVIEGDDSDEAFSDVD
ncbi:MAG: hypothetical protein ACT4QC_16985 [Planctomycetaceae bacterium]